MTSSTLPFLEIKLPKKCQVGWQFLKSDQERNIDINLSHHIRHLTHLGASLDNASLLGALLL